MDISLIIPAHNEQERLAQTLNMYGEVFNEQFAGRHEIIVVANMCSDDTVLVARQAQRTFPAIRVIDINRRIGKGGAIIAGIREARGARIVFADADGSTAPETLLHLLEQLDTHDLAIGSRRLAESQILARQPVVRQLFSLLFTLVIRLLFRLPFTDTQCGAKAMRRSAAHQLAAMITETHWVFDLDLLLAARALGLSVDECPVVWAHRPGSKLKVASASRQVVAALWRLWGSERQRAAEQAQRSRALAGSARGQLRILALNWRCLKHPQAGGSEVNLFEQARRWVREGHQVTVFCADPGPAYVSSPVEEVDGITVRHQGGRFSVYCFAALYMLLHAHEYDRILDIANGVPFFAPLFTRTPTTLLIHHVHGQQWFEEFPSPIAAVGRFIEDRIVPLIYRNNPVVAVSPSTREALLGLGFANEQLHTVYNGVAHPEAPPEFVATQQVAYIGRLKQYKRVDRLVQIVDRLRVELPDIHLDIVGVGDVQANLQALIERLSLQRHVTLHGYVDDAQKGAILARTMVFATASMHEGWGISVLEANAYGCPAVAYNVPGLAAAIRHGETGLLAESDAEFERGLAALLSDAATRNRMGRNARHWADRFSWAETARATLRVIRHSIDWQPEAAQQAQEEATIPGPPLPVMLFEEELREREVGGSGGD